MKWSLVCSFLNIFEIKYFVKTWLCVMMIDRHFILVDSHAFEDI